MLSFWRKSVQTAWYSLLPNSSNLQIFDNSAAIAAIQVVILLTISSSIDIKKNYFANSCNSNAGSMEVEGLFPSSYVDNIHQGKKKTTRTTPNEKKQYSTVIYTH